MEKILILVAQKGLSSWKLANTDIPGAIEVESYSDDSVSAAIERLQRLAIPSLLEAKPLISGQIFDDLENFLSETDNFRRSKRTHT